MLSVCEGGTCTYLQQIPNFGDLGLAIVVTMLRFSRADMDCFGTRSFAAMQSLLASFALHASIVR